MCTHMVIVMLIFKYFKCVATGTELDEHEDKGLPEPIKLANAKVANVTPCNNRTRPYLMVTPAQRYEVGKQASEYGVTASINFTRGTV